MARVGCWKVTSAIIVNLQALCTVLAVLQKNKARTMVSTLTFSELYWFACSACWEEFKLVACYLNLCKSYPSSVSSVAAGTAK